MELGVPMGKSHLHGWIMNLSFAIEKLKHLNANSVQVELLRRQGEQKALELRGMGWAENTTP